MLNILDYLSKMSGGYIISIPLIIVIFAMKYQRERDKASTATFTANIMAFYIGFLLPYQGEIGALITALIWVMMIIPISIALLTFLKESSDTKNIDLKKLQILSIPRRITVLLLGLLILSVSLMITDTMMNRPVVLETHSKLMQRISESDDPEGILLSQINPVYGWFDIVQNIDQIQNGIASIVNSTPWSMNLLVKSSTQSEDTTWEFMYRRNFGKWEFYGMHTKQSIPKQATSGIAIEATDAIHKVSTKYNEPTPQIITAKRMLIESTKQLMYIILIKGNFQKGEQHATNLEFSVLADGTKVWALRAFNDDNNKDIWQETTVNLDNSDKK